MQEKHRKHEKTQFIPSGRKFGFLFYFIPLVLSHIAFQLSSSISRKPKVLLFGFPNFDFVNNSILSTFLFIYCWNNWEKIHCMKVNNNNMQGLKEGNHHQNFVYLFSWPKWNNTHQHTMQDGWYVNKKYLLIVFMSHLWWFAMY
jgi:hypothetical protein